MTMINLLIQYAAAPAHRFFRLVTLAELKAIEAEIQESEASANQTEWARDSWTTDTQGVALAIAAAQGGHAVLVAQDEDGYYFAETR